MRKLIIFLMAVLFVFTTSANTLQLVNAESLNDIKNKLNKLDKEKLEISEKKSGLSSKKAETDQKIKDNLSQQETVKSEMDIINEELGKTEQEIQSKENEISQTNEEIAHLENQLEQLAEEIDELKHEIVELQISIQKREELLKERLRAIQKNGGQLKYMEVLLGAKSFSEFISRTTAVTTIMDQDKSIMDALEADRRLMEAKKVQVEQKKEEIESNKLEVEKKKEALESQKRELDQLKSQLDRQMAEKERVKGELEAEQEQLEDYKMSVEEEQELLRAQEAAIQKAMQQAKQKQKELERASQQNQNNSGTTTAPNATPPKGNGLFMWPASGYITDYFGTRGGSHKGIDVGNATAREGGDVPIYAAADGVVTRAYYSTTYGNVVFITHVLNGKQYETVYAHLKYSPMVGNLQVVSKGQQIGIMGNTGRSFGPHLHFEIHSPKWNMSKSNALNPLNFLP